MKANRFDALALLLVLAASPIPAQNMRAIYNQVSGVRLPVPQTAAARSVLNAGNDKIDPGLRALVTEKIGRAHV